MTQTYFSDIHPVLVDRLTDARSEIVAALAFFTHRDLIELLATKAQAGIKVELIVATNPPNEGADYSAIEAAGGTVTWIPAKGFSGMHHKFCVIDQTVAITGSYNWTYNAEKNHENIIVTQDPQAVGQYHAEFYALKNGILSGTSQPYTPAPEPEETAENTKEKDFADFEAEWNKYLNTNILAFDRAELKELGKQTAASTQGNPTVILQQLDTIYQGLLSDTEIDAADIEVLKGRLNQQVLYHEEKNNTDCRNSLHVADMKMIASKRTLDNQLATEQSQQEKYTQESAGITGTQIPLLQRKRERIQEEINDLDLNLATPPLRKRFWLETGLLTVLSLYLFWFYSSVIYNVLYGREDAMKYLTEYGQLPEVEIFNGAALALAWDRGFTVIAFIALFTILPFAFGFKFHRGTHWTRWIYMGAAIILDVLLAYLITKNCYAIDILADREQEAWTVMTAFTSARFWIVLAMGLAPYLVWGGLIDDSYSQMDRSSKSDRIAQNHTRKAQLQDKSSEVNREIDELERQKLTIEQQILGSKGRVAALENDIAHLEYEIAKKKYNIEAQHSERQKSLHDYQENILMNLNRKRIPVSTTSLKDRINTFLTGWDEWLYSDYSNRKATELANLAHVSADEWLSNKQNELR